MMTLQRFYVITFCILLLALPCLAGVNVNNSAVIIGNANIPGHYPMTVGGWIKATSLQADGDGMVGSGTWGGGTGSGWNFHTSDTFNCGSAVMDFVKGGATDQYICSSLTVPTGVWVFVAAVVTSNNVHFVMMTAAGTITEQDVANSTAFTSSTNVIQVGSSVRVAGVVFKFNGVVANVFVDPTAALTDAELKAQARAGGPALLGHPGSFWPFYFTTGVSAKYANIGNGFYAMGLNAGTALNANHCPCGQPMHH